MVAELADVVGSVIQRHESQEWIRNRLQDPLAGCDSEPGFPAVIAVSGLLGAALLLVADTVGRLVLASGELSVGIVLSVIGAPIFIFLARSLKRERAHAQN